MLEELEFPDKTTDLLEMIDKLYHVMLYLLHKAMCWNPLITYVIVDIGIMVYCKPSYHTTSVIDKFLLRNVVRIHS